MKEQKETFMNQQTSSQGTLGDIVKALLIKPNDNSAIDSVKEEIKAQASNTTNLLATLLPLIMQKPQDNTSERMMEMMMKMQEMTMQNQKELTINMQTNMKELREDTMKLITELKKETDSASKRDPLELYLTAMKQGMDQRALIEELAEEKANARSAKEDSDEGSNKNDSLADTIIKAAIPSLMGAFANKGMPQPMPEQQQVQYRPQVRANPAPQRGVPRQAGSVSVAGQQSSQARASEGQNGSGDTRQNQDFGRQSIPNGSSGKQNSLGLPTVGAKTVEIEPNSSILEKEKLNEAEYHKAKEMVIEIMSPVIVNSLLNQLSPVEGSRECATILIQNNMNPLVVHRMFTEQEILDLANNLGNINDQEYPGVGAWLKEFYDNIPTESQKLLNGSGNT
jgi:hypothetical protein